jgi:hypothetical protein
MRVNDDPRGLALYLVYNEVASMAEWLTHTLGFVERGRSVDSAGVVRNAELAAGTATLLLERVPGIAGSRCMSRHPRPKMSLGEYRW